MKEMQCSVHENNCLSDFLPQDQTDSLLLNMPLKCKISDQIPWRFDDKDTRTERRETDKLASLREVFEISINKMKNVNIQSEYTTIDEQLVEFRGQSSFKMYMYINFLWNL